MESEQSDEVTDTSETCGVPKAILTCRQNSHPFQERVLNLDHPVKIGRSVARIRASIDNGIFDCKVLSRNHAIMWYENEKFYIQDTKSSNGTFVNSQRLSRGAEDSPPRELWSGDVLQFGVDVLENQRKGNEESDSCDDSVHLVTHGCIVATVKLILPNGKEAKPSSSNNAQSSLPQEDLYALQAIIQEAAQREEHLRGKLEELENIVITIQETSQDALNHRFEESRLLSKIAALEKRIKILNKLKSGESNESDVVAQLLADIEKLQGISRDIQERLHRDLLLSEESLTEARKDGANLLTEVLALRDTSKLSEEKIHELAEKCSGYASTIENLETMFKVQSKEKAELELKLEGLQLREELLQKLLAHPLGKVIYEHLRLEEGYEGIREPGANVDKVVGEWYDRFFPELKDHVNGRDAWKLIRRLLDAIFAEMDQSKREYDALVIRKQSLIMKLEAAKLPLNSLVKTENYTEDVNDDVESDLQGVTKNNETVAALEKELKEIDGLMLQARIKIKTFESRCRKMKADLDTAMKTNPIESGDINDEKGDPDDSDAFSVDQLRQLVESLSIETEKGDDNYEKFILPKKQNNSTQTDIIPVSTKETSTNEFNCAAVEPMEISAENREIASYNANMQVLDSVDAAEQAFPTLRIATGIEQENVLRGTMKNTEDKSEAIVETPFSDNHAIMEGTKKGAGIVNTEVNSNLSQLPEVSDASQRLEDLIHNGETHPEAMSLWEKIRRIYAFCDETLSEIPAAEERLSSVREMINLVSEDMVTLLVHDRKREEEIKQLQERLSRSLSEADLAALTFAMDIKTIIIVSLIAFAIYYLLSLVFDI